MRSFRAGGIFVQDTPDARQAAPLAAKGGRVPQRLQGRSVRHLLLWLAAQDLEDLLERLRFEFTLFRANPRKSVLACQTQGGCSLPLRIWKILLNAFSSPLSRKSLRT